MKNLVKISNNFCFIDFPDSKVYTINELKNCVIPPIYILYEHQIYHFEAVDNSNMWVYKTVLSSASTEKKEQSGSSSLIFHLKYDPYTQTIVSAETIENYLNGSNSSTYDDPVA